MDANLLSVANLLYLALIFSYLRKLEKNVCSLNFQSIDQEELKKVVTVFDVTQSLKVYNR